MAITGEREGHGQLDIAKMGRGGVTEKVGLVVEEFKFENGAHTVRDVAKTVFDSCNISLDAEGDNPIASPVTITLIASGEHFYMCTVPTHCTAGQRLAINVTGTPIQAPPPPNGSGPSLAVAALPITLLSIAMALLY